MCDEGRNVPQVFLAKGAFPAAGIEHFERQSSWMTICLPQTKIDDYDAFRSTALK
jgi:hypothetical protein